MAKKRARITFELPPEVNRMIRKEARRQGMTLSNFIWSEMRKRVLDLQRPKGASFPSDGD